MRVKTFYDLLFYKTCANLRIEVSRYYLNYLWWVIDPFLNMAVFYVIFGIFMPNTIKYFIGFLLCGLTSWDWFGRTLNNSSASIIGGQVLMQQINIPKVFFPLEVVLQDFFKHLFAMSMLLVFLLFYSSPVTVTWIALPLIMIVQFVFVAGLGVLVAAVVPFFPDLRFVITTVLQLLFFASGIFFKIEDIVLPKHQAIMYLNPMAGLIKAYNQTLIYGVWPDWFYLGKVFICAMVLFSFAIWLVFRLDHMYPRICQQ